MNSSCSIFWNFADSKIYLHHLKLRWNSSHGTRFSIFRFGRTSGHRFLLFGKNLEWLRNSSSHFIRAEDEDHSEYDGGLYLICHLTKHLTILSAKFQRIIARSRLNSTKNIFTKTKSLKILSFTNSSQNPLLIISQLRLKLYNWYFTQLPNCGMADHPSERSDVEFDGAVTARNKRLDYVDHQGCHCK